LIIPTTEPYVPETIRNVPAIITNPLQKTIKYHRISRVLPQLSYSHIQPIGWKDIRVPRSAPIRETRLLNTGIALAIIYAVITTLNVQRSQVVQCRRVLAERCLVSRRRRTKIYLLGTYTEG
jgi:hypothetical protein